MSNGEIQAWDLTDASLYMRLAVFLDRKARKNVTTDAAAATSAANAATEGDAETKAKPQKGNTDIFEVKIRQFPSDILAESVGFDVSLPENIDIVINAVAMRGAGGGGGGGRVCF